MTREEEWKPIIDFSKIYEISSEGRVRNIITGKILKNQFSKQTGYFQVHLYGNIIKRWNIHSLVANHFLGMWYMGKVINHKDGNKLNNFVENLEWVTQKENIQHSIRMGMTNQKGEDNPIAKLKEFEVIQIRQLYSFGDYSQNDLSKKFNISRSVIKDIINQRTWKHLIKS